MSASEIFSITCVPMYPCQFLVLVVDLSLIFRSSDWVDLRDNKESWAGIHVLWLSGLKRAECPVLSNTVQTNWRKEWLRSIKVLLLTVERNEVEVWCMSFECLSS